MRRLEGVVGVAALVIAVFGGQLVFAGATEGYCIVWPSIGTRFAAGYREAHFARVRPGMTQAEVVDLIGRPLGAGIAWRSAPSWGAQWRPGDEVWTYSSDSSALGGDWAWLSREVMFRQGVVVQTMQGTYYD